MKALRRLKGKLWSEWGMCLARLYRVTGWSSLVAVFRWRRNILLSAEELVAIAAMVRERPGNMLVFGAGNDSAFWHELNRGHLTVFLESHRGWMKDMGKQCSALQICHVVYTSRLGEMRLPEEQGVPPPALELPEIVRQQNWQHVLVDAPQGWGDGPGRIQSVFEAKRLVATDGRIFVHDCDREGEQYLVSFYLKDLRCTRLTPRLWAFEAAGD